MRTIDKIHFEIEEGGKCAFLSLDGSPVTIRLDDIDMEHLMEKIYKTFNDMEDEHYEAISGNK